MTLGVAKNFSVAYHHPTCVFVSLLGIISIRENKREGRTTLQSQPKSINVRRRWFFKIHAHPVRDSKGSCHHQIGWNLQKTQHFELCQPVKFFWRYFRPSTRIVVTSYILKSSEKNFGVITIKTSRWRRKKPSPPETGLLESEPLCRANVVFANLK